MNTKKITLKEFALQIEADNEKFAKMTPARKRVTVAKDCLLRIELNQIQPSKGNLFRKPFFNGIYHDTQAKKLLNTNTTFHCEACAKGGLLLAYVGRANELNYGELSSGNSLNDTIHMKLREIFTPEQLALIEFAFEGKQYLHHYKVGDKWHQINFTDEVEINAVNFYNSYDESNERLIAICKNMIKNKGKFIP
jgi:hypothetical protein